MNAALEFKSVSIRYPRRQTDTISNISFTIYPGEKAALLGLNGSGKTSLLLAAVGLIPFSGSIIVDGIPLEERNFQKVRERTGFLFNIPEDQILFPRVLDDVSYGLIRKGVAPLEAREKALSVLEMLGIDETAELSPYQLSHGQRQRIALAGALVTNPSLLLLDEPSSALDPPGRLSLAEILQKIDSSILLATHDIEFASRICSRFLVIKDREIREYSSSGEISF
ncbi:MAG TPA: ABC transporter ATP-binding protein [Chitinispirillaceae bacterium]|jgi:energy-coupling factor transporter ATP-binding protein EcfA2|nr:ABC transporter ATP-binding protein [Chitinispirillaceae bacterium]